MVLIYKDTKQICCITGASCTNFCHKGEVNYDLPISLVLPAHGGVYIPNFFLSKLAITDIWGLFNSF